MTETRPKIIAIVGPTASGKTNLARLLAEKCDGEIVSADSRQVYRGLDIGAGKDGELQSNTTALTDHYPKLRYLKRVPQWLIDIKDPSEVYTVADWQKDALVVIEDILKRQKVPIITGGTGLYVSALLEGYDFSERGERDSQNPRHAATRHYIKQPPAWDVLSVGIDLPREELYRRIDQRLDERIKTGLIDEGRKLVADGISYERLRSFGLEYRYLADLLEGKLTEAEFAAPLATAIHQFARRQITWWRHHGQVQWVKNNEEALGLAEQFLTT